MPRKTNSDSPVTVSGGAAAAPRRQTSVKTRTNRAIVKKAADAAPSAPSREEIAALAYALWEARGCQGGSPEEDWLRAEEQLTARASTATA
jgi:hypothetical protein